MTRLAPDGWAESWPANVWAGCTVEDQEHAEQRIPHILKVPARVRFLSVEPMLSAIDLTDLVQKDGPGEHHYSALECDVDAEDDGDWRGATISWVICGGESGPKARPMDLAWARDLRDQCAAAGTSYFMKQLGEVWARESGTWNDDSQGGSLEFWPEDLRVRQFPQAA